MKCINCDSGYVLTQPTKKIVTREMAKDAGFPEMEGEVFSETNEDYDICDCCHGDYKNCEYCEVHKKDF